MSDHAKADALVDDILNGGRRRLRQEAQERARAQYATGDEHHSDELGLLEDLGDVMGVGNLFGGGKKKGKKKKGGGGGSHKHLDFDVFTGATTVTDDGGDDDDGWDDDGGGSEGSEELDSDGVLSDEGGGRGGDDDSSDGALSDIGDAAAAFARKGADALTRLAATKTFMCHIHNIKLQSLERRRRDLILHFSVGVPDEDVSAEVEAEAAAEAEAEGDGADGGDGDGKKKKKRELPSEEEGGRRGRRGGREEGEEAEGPRHRVHRAGAARRPRILGRAILGRAILGRAILTADLHPTSTGRARQDGGVQAPGARQVARAVRRRAEQALRVALVERGRFGGTGELDAVLINLEQIAGGSIQQEVAFSERDGRRVIETYRASFHIYFQEAFTFALNFTDCRRALSIPRHRRHATPHTAHTPPIYTYTGAPRT